MEKLKKIKINKPLIILFLFCGILSFLMCFSPFAQGNGHGYDSAIYAAVANALNHGKILYTGIVDNKGPFMYFIDSVGLLINYDFGIFFIEMLFLFIGTYFAYKTAMLITKNNKWLSCFTVISAMLLLVYTIDGGNYTEEYALFFTNIATYFIVKFIINNNKLKWYELLIIGTCFAATFLLRANLCAFFAAQVIVIFISLIINKEYKNLLYAMMWIVLGGVLFLLPFIIYLGVNGALSACLNMVYLNVVNGFGKISLSERYTKTIGLMEIAECAKTFFIVGLSTLILFTKPIINKPIKKIVIFSLIGVVFNIYVNSLTGGPAWAYTHYYISFVPIMVVITAWLFEYVYSKIKSMKFNSEATNLILIILGFLLMVNPAKDLLLAAVKRYQVTSPETSILQQYIIDNSSEVDTIQIIGLDDTLYYSTNRISTSRHLYFAGGFSAEKRTQDANELATDLINAKEPAKIILFGGDEIEETTFYQSLSDQKAFLHFIKERYTFDKVSSNNLNCMIYLLKA